MNKLKHLFCIALAAVVTVTSFVMTPMEAKADGDTIITVPITVQEEYSMANEFFQIMNQKRAEAGLPEYKLDTGLMDMAMERAAELCIYFDHKSLTTKNIALTDKELANPLIGNNFSYSTEDIADGTGDAASTYKVWYDSLGHRAALTGTNYNYCGIGVVTYHNNIKWSLIVSSIPGGNEIDSVSGSKTNTRNIDAKAKYFSRKKVGALDEWVNNSFAFSDIGSGRNGYYIQQAGIFTFKNNNPELIDIDSMGRLKPKANGKGTFTVYYKNIELCTVSVTAYHDEEETVTPTPTPSSKPTEPTKPTNTQTPTQPPKQTETTPAKPTVKPNNSQQTVTKLTVKVSNVTYNGKSQKPSVKVYSGKKQLSSKYYTVSYKNNKNVGYGTVTVKGKGSYSKASGTAKFKINLKKPIFSYTKSTKRNTFTIIWKKTGGNSGWQVQYSLNKKFRSGVRTVNLKFSNTRLTVRNLRSRKNYYVRVRSYKKVGRQTWYSGWSSVKSVRIR